MNEQVITKALFEYFNSDDWACFDQLRLGSGHDCERTIDFFAMHVHPSKKFQTLAIEIKVSRSDFLRDKCNPDKRLAAMTICDQFIYAAPKGLLEHRDMPTLTALWEYNPETNKMLDRPHWPSSKVAKLTVPSLSFVASVLRRQCRKESLERRKLKTNPAGAA